MMNMILHILRTMKSTRRTRKLNKLYSLKFNSQMENNIFTHVSEKSMKIGSHARLIGNKLSGNISVGSNTWITNSILSSKNSQVEIGKYTLMQDYTQAVAKHNKITVGNFCTIGLGTALASFAHCYHNYTSCYLDKRLLINKSTRNSYSSGGVTIGHDCLIGRRSYIGPAVQLGNGCIVFPNSVVTTSFEPYSIIAGTPAVKMGKRFSNKKIEYLNELNWYEWDQEKILKNMDFLLSPVKLEKVFL